MSYLIDKRTLDSFIIPLISIKVSRIPGLSFIQKMKLKRSKELKERLREQLDEKISLAIFGSLNAEQLDEIDKLLDNPNTPSKVFDDFFKRAGVDTQKIIEETMKKFADDFFENKIKL